MIRRNVVALAFILGICVGVASAQERPVPQPPSSSLSMCVSLSTMATSIMRDRQRGVSPELIRAKWIKETDDQAWIDIMEILMINAFAEPVSATPMEQESAARAFGRNAQQSCVAARR